MSDDFNRAVFDRIMTFKNSPLDINYSFPDLINIY
jgi:hypothetical protein